MDQEYTYEALAKRAGFRIKPRTAVKIVTYTVGGLGIILFVVGILLIASFPLTFCKSGVILASVGLLLSALVYPLHHILFSKLIKRRLNKLIKILEEE